MLIEKKLTKYIGIFIVAFGIISLYLASSDLWTSALYFSNLFGATVFKEMMNFPLGQRVVGEVDPTTFESFLVALALFVVQILFALKGKLARKGSTEQRMYYIAYVLCAFADTYTDIMYRKGSGPVSTQLVIVSVLLYNIGSEWGITLAVSWIWEWITSFGGDWFGNAKQNVKNLTSQNNNQNKRGGSNQKQRHDRQQPQHGFASENNVRVSTQPRQRQMNVDGRTVGRA